MEKTFPPNFIWGMANSSYQTEGAWDEDGKGESIWDQYCHLEPSPIKDGSNADVGMDSYHRYKEDVQLLRDMNAKMYRFSISWPRVLPNGRLPSVNEKGIEYYNSLINELLKYGIEPCVTLFHWDLPQSLQAEFGGFTSEEIIPLFVDFATLCFQRYADRVKVWITFNEPWVFSMKAYDFAVFAPGIKEPLEAPYRVVHNMLKAHALAAKIYREGFQGRSGGQIGVSVDTSNYSPMKEGDEDAVEKAWQFRIGWIAAPLLKGDYPSIMKESIAKQSAKEGRSASRLPEFTSSESSLLKGSIDFLGLNYYTSELVQNLEKLPDPSTSLTNSPGWNRDLGLDRIRDHSGKLCGVWWQRDVPTGLRRALNWIKKEYQNFPVIITENGRSCDHSNTEDEERVDFYRGHLEQLWKAVKEDGCDVRGYLGWCLLDVFEWADGYTVGFGVHQVQRDCPNLTRRKKRSALFLGKVFKENRIE